MDIGPKASLISQILILIVFPPVLLTSEQLKKYFGRIIFFFVKIKWYKQCFIL